MMKLESKLLITLFILLTYQWIQGQENKITIQLNEGKDTISKHIYGHFAEHLGRCIYDGFYVGADSKIPNINGIRKDVVEALRELEIPVLRWPGGCFAEQYHWKDGIGPKKNRPSVVNIFWGEVSEDNSFGTHEFLELCELLQTEPYIAVNIASGTVQDASEWIEYVTSDKDSYMTRLRKQNGREKPWEVKYWGIGNENWGCGGNMDVSYYTDVFKRFSTYCNGEYKIASGGLNNDFEWTRTFMTKIQRHRNLAQGLSYHYYTIVHNWANKGSATDFVRDEWFKSMQHTNQMKSNLEGHIAIMDELDPENKVALIADEWGTWYDVEPGTNPGFLYQQNTLRDAVVAALGLNIFNNQARRIKMANIAQTINVLQAMILTKGDQMVRTPTYHVFKMYKVHQDALLLPSEVSSKAYKNGENQIPSLSVSASKNRQGEVHISIANLNPDESMNSSIELNGMNKFGNIKGEIITSDRMNALNDFGKEEEVYTKAFTNFKTAEGKIEIKIPAKSVVLLKVAY